MGQYTVYCNGKPVTGTGTDRAQLATILMRFAQQTKA